MSSIQSDVNSNLISSLEPEGKGQIQIEKNIVHNNTENFIEQYQLKFELDKINKDIKVCELYKKNLEKEIKDFKKCISNKKNIEEQITFLKVELINLQKEQDLLKIENKALSLETERLLKYKEKITSDTDLILKKLKKTGDVQNFTTSYKETLQNELIILEKTKNALLEEISGLKEEKMNINSDVEKLNSESNSLQEKFLSELDKIKSNLGLKNNNYNTPPETEGVIV
jgi:chromosome segregation ATPase